MKDEKFGKWTVISETPFKKSEAYYLTCICECGNIVDVAKNSLKNGKSTQCIKCSNKSKEKDDKYVGKTFGEIYVAKVDDEYFREKKRKKYICRCSCGYEFSSFSHNLVELNKCKNCKEKDRSVLGNIYTRLTVLGEFKKGNIEMCNCLCICGKEVTVRRGDLISGKTKSCGCLAKEVKSKSNKTHGMAKTRLHNIWKAMKQRCYYTKSIRYNDYGGRGVIICDEWENDFMSFYNWAMNNGYNDTLTIDRIDVNGNYEPSNCRWVDVKIQSNNKRNNRKIEYKNETKTLKEWSDILGINYSTLRTQTKKYTLEEILEGRKNNE